MLVLLIVPLSEIKSYVVVLSFYIKQMKRRTLQACILRHAFCLGQNGLVEIGQGGSPPPSPSPLGYAPVIQKPQMRPFIKNVYESVFKYVLLNCTLKKDLI